ncbi:MAG: four helix bundle protein [Dysgonamonadaceae bacterium]|jgi:four helix bundle protein|nr:four helix bundle protein [Dysgonamonadaceae bacterium]
MEECIIKNKSFIFAIRIVLYKMLCNDRNKFVLSKQLLRSGMSIGASVRETLNAQSGMDFIRKYAVAQKECIVKNHSRHPFIKKNELITHNL